ncbi:type I 3-dehydroquinate dehydratase [Staphylococcus massiliensis]|uniref:3-dehydroquinate dehydratase n=1 Tax=Staphylococcus massiliensis S46 TaxID=1229783 RepID=K9ASX2_9STAP|nr:type I 3-dehydroquinate dehydratase [Staphylococcus massiliensis]EKU45727.1 3-dehydroquinate dehydratase [Staphylococcus massiliensis S46]MCG3400419.1 type I 3-dehydroquinate dehydratase [Staphylococcus massiliensis]MCG3401736.1 type I 3-dehydroquinate dehydratase [Staphylococcus massiliensis]MCG3413491.1 type I 3-dehydroquinate dehydratase [Staphylococcus massiliensis]POA01330.1 type I 3-dehydroquinate dehydratase [Staphylococcus massiliensis CCUG 55927]
MDTKVAVTIAPEHLNELNQDIMDIKANEEYIDVIELRIDQIDHIEASSIDQYLSVLSDAHLELPILLTYRTGAQGGKGQLEGEDYLTYLERLLNLTGFQMIDIEWDERSNTQLLEKLVAKAKAHHIEVLISYHNFKYTPSSDVLRKTYYHMSQLQGDILKIAVMPLSHKDTFTLLEVLEHARDSLDAKVVGISMGDLGIMTRTAQNMYGGYLSYGCLNDSQAPGQIPVKTLKNQLKFYQQFAKSI